MNTVKQQMLELVNQQPLDATYEEIMRDLALQNMINRGLEDSKHQRTLSNEEMQQRIQAWQP